MKYLLLLLALFSYISTSSAEFNCPEDKIPSSLGSKFLPLVTGDNTIEFLSFENAGNGNVNAVFWKGIDLTVEPSGCPYEKAMQFPVLEPLKTAGAIIFGSNPSIEMSEENGVVKAQIVGGRTEGVGYTQYAVQVDTSQKEFLKLIYFYPDNNPITPKRYGQILRNINGRLFSFGGKDNLGNNYKDIWRYYEKGNKDNTSIQGGWVKKTDLGASIKHFSMIDVFQKGTEINILLRQSTDAYVYTMNFDPSSNSFMKPKSAPVKLNGVSFPPSSSHSILCNSEICKMVIQSGADVKIIDLNSGLIINKTLKEEITNGQIFLSNDRVVVNKGGRYYSGTQEEGDDFITLDLFGYSGSDSSGEACKADKSNTITDFSYVNSKGEDSMLDTGVNQVLTYKEKKDYCLVEKRLLFQTKHKQCEGGNCIRFQRKCVKRAGCDYIRSYMRAYMPFKFDYFEQGQFNPQPIFTFTKNNTLNFSGNFDLGDKKIIGLFAKEGDDKFKGFNRKEINKMFNVDRETRTIDIVKDNKGTSDPGDDGVKLKGAPRIRIDTGGVLPGYVFGGEGGIDTHQNEVSSGSFNYTQEFGPGHHTLHLIFLAQDKNQVLGNKIRANILYGFGGGKRAYATWQGKKQDLGAQAFSSDPKAKPLGATKPDNYNIYYHVLVYDFYVPEITNFGSEKASTSRLSQYSNTQTPILGGHKPVLRGSGAAIGADISFYSGYSKDISLKSDTPDLSSLIGYSPRLNGMPQNMPAFKWNEETNLPFVTVQSTRLTHKIRSGGNGEFSFKPVTNFPYLEGQNLAVIQNSDITKNYLNNEEKETYQISAQYMDDKGNLIGAKPVKFKLKKSSSEILFHHNLNSAGEYETDSIEPIIIGSYLPNKIIGLSLNGTKLNTFTRTNSLGDFSIKIPLDSGKETNKVTFYKYSRSGKSLGSLDIKSTERQSPEIISPLSGEQFYSRYIGIECNAKPNSTVYLKFWIEELIEDGAVYGVEYPPIDTIEEIEINTNDKGECFSYSPKLKYIHEHSAKNSVYSVSASYEKDGEIFDRSNFRMRAPSSLPEFIGENENDYYLTPSNLKGRGDDIAVLSEGKLRFELSRFRNQASPYDFSGVGINTPGVLSVSPGVSTLISPLSSIKIIDFSGDQLIAILPKGTTVTQLKTGLTHTIYNSGVYHHEGNYLRKGDIISAPKSGAMIDFVTSLPKPSDKSGNEVKIQSYGKINFIGSQSQGSNKAYVIADKDSEYSFGESDLVINGACNTAMKEFFDNFSKETGLEGLSDISRHDCLIYSQVFIDPDKSPKLLFPRSSSNVKSGEKLKVAGYAWPGSKVRLLLNGSPIGSTTTNKDGIFSFVSGNPLPIVSEAQTSTLYLEDVDQDITARQKIIINILPPEYDNYDTFPGKPGESEVTEKSSFFDVFPIFNLSFLNKKK